MVIETMISFKMGTHNMILFDLGHCVNSDYMPYDLYAHTIHIS